MDYKVLGFNQESHHGGVGKWRKRQWRTAEGDLIPCQNGIHYCRREHLIHWLGPTIWTFEDGTPEETIDHGDKMVTRKGRIVSRVETWNDTTARLFAADCAEAVVHLVPEPHREPCVNAISVARSYARGNVGEHELAAARDAARDAAWDAARADQTVILFDYLEGRRS